MNAKPTKIMVLDERLMWPLEIDTVLLVSLSDNLSIMLTMLKDHI